MPDIFLSYSREDLEPLGVLIIAYWAGGLSDRDLAMTALRQGIVDLRGNPSALWLISIRAAGRRSAIQGNPARSGLVDYFRASGNWEISALQWDRMTFNAINAFLAASPDSRLPAPRLPAEFAATCRRSTA